MTEASGTELAYLAGIIDGEGCIYITLPGTSGSYALMVKIANSDVRMIRWIHSRFGGNVRPKTMSKSNRKQCWEWAVASTEAEAILRLVEKYLVSKREQALLALEFRASFTLPRPCGSRPLPSNVVEFRRTCYEEMKRLKRVVNV